MKFVRRSKVDDMPSTRKAGRGLEIVLALGLVLAALVPVAASGPKPEVGHEATDFRTVATQLINADLLNPATRVRKNAKELGDGERRQFVEAVQKLKTVDSPFETVQGLNYYDQFVQWHKDLYKCTPGAHHAGVDKGMTMSHASPLFLPWHRVYLLMFENALREVTGKSISVPYWDWTDPEATKSVFRDDLMGGHGVPEANFAISGPFNAKDWKLTVQPEGAEWVQSSSTHIMRQKQLPQADYAKNFPTPQEVSSLLGLGQYDDAPYDTRTVPADSFRTTLEGFIGDPYPQMVCGPDGWMVLLVPSETKRGYPMHNLVHKSVGGVLLVSAAGVKLWGTMTTPTSPNDPVFFLHHANVDRLWAEWQAKDPVLHAYRPQSGYPGLNGTDFMQPWNMTPNSVESIKKLGYHYE